MWRLGQVSLCLWTSSPTVALWQLLRGEVCYNNTFLVMTFCVVCPPFWPYFSYSIRLCLIQFLFSCNFCSFSTTFVVCLRMFIVGLPPSLFICPLCWPPMFICLPPMFGCWPRMSVCLPPLHICYLPSMLMFILPMSVSLPPMLVRSPFPPLLCAYQKCLPVYLPCLSDYLPCLPVYLPCLPVYHQCLYPSCLSIASLWWSVYPHHLCLSRYLLSLIYPNVCLLAHIMFCLPMFVTLCLVLTVYPNFLCESNKP